jgi:hypothetical protein
MPRPYNPTVKDGRAVQLDNQDKVLMAVRHFGHLRRHELAMAVWPKASARSAYVMAWRTVSVMVKAGYLLEKLNSLGGVSVVLAAKGVSRLREMEVKAHEGYDLAFDGPQFFHRTLGTNYLLEKARAGDEVFGEYSILRGWSPVNKEHVRSRFKKIPDGLIVRSGRHLGLRDNIRVADWIEVESAFKAYDDIARALSLLTKESQLDTKGELILNKLVFVYDSRQKHEKQLARYIKKFLKEHPQLSPEAVLSEIVFARCYVDIPFVWHGVEELSAAQLIGATNDLDTDTPEPFTEDDY